MVSVDEEKCIGCGMCVSVCPEVFKLENGKSHVIKSKKNPAPNCVKEAAESCPVGAIKA